MEKTKKHNLKFLLLFLIIPLFFLMGVNIKAEETGQGTPTAQSRPTEETREENRPVLFQVPPIPQEPINIEDPEVLKKYIQQLNDYIKQLEKEQRDRFGDNISVLYDYIQKAKKKILEITKKESYFFDFEKVILLFKDEIYTIDDKLINNFDDYIDSYLIHAPKLFDVEYNKRFAEEDGKYPDSDKVFNELEPSLLWAIDFIKERKNKQLSEVIEEVKENVLKLKKQKRELKIINEELKQDLDFDESNYELEENIRKIHLINSKLLHYELIIRGILQNLIQDFIQDFIKNKNQVVIEAVKEIITNKILEYSQELHFKEEEINSLNDELNEIKEKEKKLKQTIKTKKTNINKLETDFKKTNTSLKEKFNLLSAELSKIEGLNEFEKLKQLEAETNNKITELKAELTKLESIKETKEKEETNKEAAKIGDKILKYMPYAGFGVVSLILVIIIIKILIGVAGSGKRRY